jgi:hypothetical protein
MATEYHPNTRTCSAWFTNGKENESQTMTFSPKVRREIQPPWMTDLSHSSTKFNFSIVRKINNPLYQCIGSAISGALWSCFFPAKKSID